MTSDRGLIRATSVALLVVAAAAQPGNDAWATDAPANAREPWYDAWLKVTANPRVDIHKTTPSLRWRSDMDTLYRGDTTGQGLSAFDNGLLPKSVGLPEAEWVYNWYSHAGGSAGTVFSSTTRNQAIAQHYAAEWVYEFNAPHGLDQVQSGGPFPAEEEISYPGGVKARFIKKACRPYDLANCQLNPNYREPTGQETMQEVAAVAIDWSRLAPAEGLAWTKSNDSLWAVSSPIINPVQGASALTQGLQGWNDLPPNLRLTKYLEEPNLSRSVVVAFGDYSDAKLWATEQASNGGWVYEVKPNTVAVDLSGSSTGGQPGAFAFIGGIKGSLLMNARRFEKGVSEPVECIGIEKQACKLENRHQ